MDRFDRLRHDAVIGRDHQHDDVGDLGAAGAHRGERGVAGRIDEGDPSAGRRGHLIGADMLGDAAGFAGRDFGRADGVEQRGLAVVDMAHDGDDRRARLQVRRIVRRIEHAFFDVGFGDAPHGVAEFLGDQLGGVGVDRIGDLRHVPLLHQDADHVDGALGHAVGQFLDGDRFRDRHFAGDLFLGLVAMAGLRCVRRRNEATERSRTSSAVSAVTTVSRPRRFSAPPRGAFGAGAGRAATPPRRAVRGASSSSASSAGRAPGLAASGVSAPKRFLATSSALRLVSSSCLRRSSSLRLRASAAARSARSDSSRLRRTRASSSASLALFRLAQSRIGERVARALRSSSVSVRSTTPEAFGAAAGAAVREPAAAAGALAGARRRRAHDRARRRAPAWPRRTDDAALDLLDHDRLAAAVAEALAHDALLDAAALERQRLGRGHAQLLAAIFGRLSHSLSGSIRSNIRVGLNSARRFRAFRSRSPVRNRSRRRQRAKNVSLEGPASRAACTTFGRPSAKSNCAEVKNRTTPMAGALRRAQRIELADPVGCGLGGMQQRNHVAVRQRRLDLGEAGDDQAGLAGHRQRVEGRPFEQASRSVDQIGGQANLPLETAGKDLALDRVAAAPPASPSPRRRGPAACS